jgi:ribonuclease HI
MKVFDAELRAIGVAHRKFVARAEVLRAHRAMTVALISDSQAAIRWMAHLDERPGHQLARAINEHARALHTHGIDAAIHWLPGHSGIPRKEESDCQGSKAREDRGYTVQERIYT